MSGSQARPYGLRFTVRHQMIVIVSLAILCSLFSPYRQTIGSLVPTPAFTWAILVEPWLLGVLLMFFDRPGPAKNWMLSCVFMLFAPAIVIHHDYVVISRWISSGAVPNPAVTCLINLFFLGAFGVFWNAMSPAVCPSCGGKSLVPLINLWGQSKRTEKTHWCASCGGLYWKASRKEWKPERRITWLDHERATNPLLHGPETTPAGPVEDRLDPVAPTPMNETCS